MAGASDGSQQVNGGVAVPVATASKGGGASRRGMGAPVVEGEVGCLLPARLGPWSARAWDGVLETSGGRERLASPGPAGCELHWGPGATHFDVVSAPCGRLLAPVGDFEHLRPPGRRLAAGGGEARPGDDRPGDRRIKKPMAVEQADSAKLPRKAAAHAVSLDIFASMDRDRREGL